MTRAGQDSTQKHHKPFLPLWKECTKVRKQVQRCGGGRRNDDLGRFSGPLQLAQASYMPYTLHSTATCPTVTPTAAYSRSKSTALSRTVTQTPQEANNRQSGDIYGPKQLSGYKSFVHDPYTWLLAPKPLPCCMYSPTTTLWFEVLHLASPD